MKNKILLIIILVLLAGNAALLYLYFNKQNRPRGKGRMMERFQKEVGLTKDQVKKFETLRQQQKEGMGADFELMNSLKKEYITALFKGTGLDSLKIRYAKDLGEKMLSLDKKMYDNIMEARKICTPEQYVAYDSIVMKMMLHLPEKRTDEKNKQ